MNKKIFVTRMIPAIGIDMLKEKGFDVEINSKDKILSKKELISILKKGNYDAVLSLLTDKIDSQVFDSTKTVKLFANYATGFDNIDIVEAKKRDILVSNAPTEFSSSSVAEHTISLAFALLRRIVESDQYTRKGKYKGWAPMNFIGDDIHGKTIGLIGAGQIGVRVASYAKALGLKVIYYDIVRNSKLDNEHSAEYFNSIEEVLKNSDIVSLHVPLLDSTHHLINEQRLKLMKKTAYLINTSRGPIIDEKALVKALKDKVIAGAGLDVFEFEPKLSSGLAKLPNVILTPHIASASVQARNQMAITAVSNIISYFENGSLKNPV